MMVKAPVPNPEPAKALDVQPHRLNTHDACESLRFWRQGTVYLAGYYIYMIIYIYIYMITNYYI